MGRRQQSGAKPTIAERLAATQARIDAKRAEQAQRYAQTKNAMLGDRLPDGAPSDRPLGLKEWVKANRQHRISELCGVHLFADRIVRAPGLVDPPAVPEGQPVARVSAFVEQEGAVSSRATLTRAVVPGLHGWQKKTDDRSVWLTIDGPDFQWVIPVPVSRMAAARQFAAQVTSAGRASTPDAVRE